MNRAMALAHAQRAIRECFPDAWPAIFAALEQKVLPQNDAPVCPKCGAPTGTPCTEDERFERLGKNLFCPACGDSWNGTPEEVAQARMSVKAYNHAQAALAKVRHDELADLLKMVAATAHARCQYCPNGATCIGTAEGSLLWNWRCDECCEHIQGEGEFCHKLTGAHPGQASLFGDGKG